MMIHYPDPYLRAEFDLFVDTWRAQSMSGKALAQESLYWNSWLATKGWLGTPVKPALFLHSIAIGLEVVGGIVAVVGVVGLFLSWFSDLITVYGLIAFLIGCVIDKYSRDSIQEDIEAVALVNRRLIVLASCHEALNSGVQRNPPQFPYTSNPRPIFPR